MASVDSRLMQTTDPHKQRPPLLARLWAPDFPFSPARWPFFYGWVIVALGTICVICSIPAQTMGVGVFTEILMDVLGLSRMDVSLAYLLGTLVSGFVLPTAGRYMDVFGGRRALVLAAVCMGLSLILLAVSDLLSDGLGLLLPFLAGAWLPFAILSLGFFFSRFWGQGILTLAARNMIGKWFDRRRGMVIGVSSIAISLAFSLSPTVLNALVQWIGWRESWIIIGLGLIVFGSSLFWLLGRDNPEECGLEMDGGEVSVAPRTNPDLIIHHDYTRAEAIRTFSFWCFGMTFAWQSLLMTAYAFHVVDIGRSMDLDPARIFALFFYSAPISIITNLAAGAISEKVRLKWLLFIENLCMLLMALALIIATPVVSLPLIVLAMGAGSGVWGNISGTVFPRFFGRRHLGAISGLGMSLMVLASALGPVFFSLSIASVGSYQAAYWASLFIAAALMVGSVWADNPQRANGGEVKDSADSVRRVRL